MPIDFYTHPISPPAQAVVITAKELNVELNVKEVDLFGGATRAPEYLKINPSHTVPTLVDNGFAIFESRAIITYLVNKYAPESSLYPKDAQARANVDKVLFFDASSYYPTLKTAFVPIFRRKEQPPQEAIDDLKEKIAILEAILGDSQFMAGDKITLADISLAVSIPIVKHMLSGLLTEKLAAWYDRVGKALPAVQAYEAALAKMTAEQK